MKSVASVVANEPENGKEEKEKKVSVVIDEECSRRDFFLHTRRIAPWAYALCQTVDIQF